MPISSIFACFRKSSSVVSFAETDDEKLGHETESKLGSNSCMWKVILFKSHKSLVADKYDKKSTVERSSSSSKTKKNSFHRLSGSSARHWKVQDSVPEDAGAEEIPQMGVVLVNKRSNEDEREEMVVVPPAKEVNLWKRRTTGQLPHLQLKRR